MVKEAEDMVKQKEIEAMACVEALNASYTVAVSVPNTDVDEVLSASVRIPRRDRDMTKTATVSLSVEKFLEQDFVELHMLSSFRRCSLSLHLSGKVGEVKDKIKRPMELGITSGGHLEEIPVETVSVSFEFTKLRTQKIGVGTIFNSELPTEQIELAEEVVRPSPHDCTVHLLTVSDKDCAYLSFSLGGQTKNEDVIINRAVEEQDFASTLFAQKIAASTSAVFEETVDKTITDILAKSLKDHSPSVIAEIEVNAGEEVATTDAIVDLLATFEEAELIIIEFTSDILDVDVTLNALMEEEFIEAVGPVFPNQFASLIVQMSTATATISQVVEKTKTHIMDAHEGTAILMGVASMTEIQQLHLKLPKTKRKVSKIFETEEKIEDVEDVKKESEKVTEGRKEKDKGEAEKKKKKIPKALVIPAEISSKYGDKSTLLSETIMTTEIAMSEEAAEVEASPKKCLSASVAMKVDSAKRHKSVTRRTSSAEEFTFKDFKSEVDEKVAEQIIKKTKKKSGLPPTIPKEKEEIEEVDLVFGQDEHRENTESILLVELVEELAMFVQATSKGRKKKTKMASEVLQGKMEQGKLLEDSEETAAIQLSPAAADIEEKDVHERVRKKRVGFIQVPDKEIIAFRGDTVTIECELVNDDNFIWFINNKPISEDSRCNEEINSLVRTLTIVNIAPEDSGTIIAAKVGDIVAETIIRVEDTLAEFTEPLPRRTFGKCGEDITLRVSVTHSAHTVNWKFNGEELPKNDENYVFTKEGNFYALTIKNATYDTAGRYSVKLDSSETSTTLIMQGAPIFDRQEGENVNFEVHENLILNIPYKAEPEPTIDCFFNGEPLLVGAKLQLEVINDTVRFCKRKAGKNDSGEYTFKISNEFGEATKMFTVNVKDVPGIPENPVVVDVILDTVNIKWDAPKDDGGSRILGYVVQKKEIGRRTFHRVIQLSSEKTHCLIEELDANTEYIFRVAAINKYGTGEFLEFPVVRTSTIPEESEAISEVEEEQEEIPKKTDKVEQELLSSVETPEIKSEDVPEKAEPEISEELKLDEQKEDIEYKELQPQEEPKKTKVKKTTKKNKSKKGEQVEEIAEYIVTKEDAAIEEATSEVKLPTEKEIEIKDLIENVETVADVEQIKASELEPGKMESEIVAEIVRQEEKTKDQISIMDKEKSIEKLQTASEEKKAKKMRKKPQKNEELSEEMISTKKEKLEEDNKEISNEEKVCKKVSLVEEKAQEFLTEYEVKYKDRKEEDVAEVSEIIKIGKMDEETELKEKPKLKKKGIKKRKLSTEKSPKMKAEEPTISSEFSDSNFDMDLQQQQQQQDIVEEMTVSEEMKIKSGKEKIMHGNLEEGHVEAKPKPKKYRGSKEQLDEKREKTVEAISVEVSFGKSSIIERIDKVIFLRENSNKIFADVKVKPKITKLKAPRKVKKEKTEELPGKEQEKDQTDKSQAKPKTKGTEKLPSQESINEENLAKQLESKSESEDGKFADEISAEKIEGDKEIKPKKKKGTKKVSKKLKVVDEESEKFVQDVSEVKLVEEAKGEVQELEGNADIDVCISIPKLSTSETPEMEEIVKTVSLIASDEKPVKRRTHKRLSGFAVSPEQEISAFRNDIVKIECELFNETDEINWIINGKPAINDERCTEISDGYLRILQIVNVVPEDTGTIITANVHEHYAECRLIIDDTPVEIIEKLPRRISGKIDDFVKLSVTVSHPTENCQWFFNNEHLIENNDQYEVTVEGVNCNLLIKNLTYDQAGRYSIKVDSAETSSILIVEGAPILNASDATVTAIDLESQENLILTVPFKAIPEPTVECFRNNEKILSSSKIQLDIFNDKVCFCKRKVDKNDAGEYMIKITNDYGEVSQIFSVNIKDVPGAPENAHITDISSYSAKVQWDVPSDDGGSAITGYIIEKRELSRRAYHRVAQVSNEITNCHLDDLKMNTSYMVRIAAVNKYGISEYLECTSFETSLPFEAPVITLPPFISNITDQSCTLKWPKVTNDGGSPIYGYDIFLRKNKNDWIKLNDELVFTEQFTVSNIEPGPTYEFKIEATNEAGLTSESNVPSEPLTVSKTGGLFSEELPILNTPAVEVLNGDAVRVQWMEVNSEKCDITSYVVKYKSEKSSVWSEKEVMHSPAEIVGLKEGLSYLFKVAPKSGPTVGEFSKETTPTRVVANKKPEITKGIKDISVSRKRELKLECHATGEPVPQYIWYKDGQEIIPASENTEIVNDGFMSILFVHHISASDAGLYRCEVVNDLGSVDTEAIVTVTEVRAHFVSSFPEYMEIDEGEEVAFSCELSDADASVVWLKDGKLLSSDDRIVIKEDDVERKLTIRNAKPEDSGKYECSTIDKKTRSEAELFVKEEQPQIKRGPQDQIVTNFGATVMLTCEVTKPVMTVKWLKNKQEIWPRQQKLHMTLEETIATLTIMDFESNDCGEYRAMLREDEKSAPAKVELQISPSIRLEKILPSTILKLHNGTDFDIDFHYEGFPEVNIVATLNDKPLNKMRSRMHTYDNKLSIRLKNICQDDSGILKVTVENEIGCASEEIQLEIINVPSKVHHLKAFNITSCSVVLKWEKADDNGSPIINYNIERRTADSKRWRNIGKCKSEQCEFLVEDLYPNESYSFRIVAVNEVGEGVPSSAVDVLTISEGSELAILDEETVEHIAKPNRPDVTQNENIQAISISWEMIEGADEYIVERSKLENHWEQIGVTAELKFEDSFGEYSVYRYRVIAKKGDHLSSPSEATEIVTGGRDETTKMLQFVSEMVEPDGPETENGRFENLEEARKIEEMKDEEVSSSTVVEEEMNAEKRKEGRPEVGKKMKSEKYKEETKLEDEVKSPEKTTEKKVKSKKVVKKKASEKERKEEKTEELFDGESKKVKKEEVKTEKEREAETEEVKGKLKIDKRKVKFTDEEAKQKVESLEAGKIGVEVDSDRKTDADDKAEIKPRDDGIVADEKLAKKKEVISKQKPKEKLDESVAEQIIPDESVSEKKEMLTEKLEVKPANNQVTVNYGTKNFELNVEISGHCDDCIWMKDEKLIDKKLVKTTSKISILQIENVDELTMGRYQCIATNSTEKAVAGIDVIVIDKPKIEFDEATTIGGKVGEMLKIHANITGLPTPTCKWLKNGDELKSDENTIITFKDGAAIVTIKKANVNSSGIYKLIAENICGRQEKEIKVQIKGVPSMPIGPLKVSDVTDSSCKLAWNPPEHDGNSKLLGYCIEKRDAKKSTWAFVARTTTTNVAITGLTDTATYYFRVAAENAFGTGPGLENQDAVKPVKFTATEKPKIKKAPGKEATGRVGDKLVLCIEFTGKPVPEVRWYRNGQEIISDENRTIMIQDGKSLLTIQKLIENDEGDYQVVLKNDSGTIQHQFSVVVQSEPIIIDADKYKGSQVFGKGQDVKLQFAFTG
uniref:Titin n=1 Tax=Setaria digitata TaxID=48799 RepID=A0A915PMX8_9BILA